MVDSTRTESMRMTLNNDLSCAVTGYIWPSTGFNSAYLVKRNSSGNAVWSKTYGGSNHTWAYDVSQTFDNGYALIGANRFNGAPDTYLIRVNSNGDTLWTKTYGGPNNDQGRSIQQTSDSGFIIAGYYYDTSLFNYDVYLIKTNAFGDTMWTKFIGDTTENTAESVALTNDGGYIISGTTYAPGSMNYYDVYLIKTDANGDTLWTKKFGGSNGPDYGFFVRQTKDGGYVISGQTQSFVFQGDPYLIKTDSMGNLVTGINKLGNIEPLIQVYPNPATNELMVSSSQFLIKHLEVLNVLGEKVSGINIINSKEVKLDVSPLPMGMYFVKVFTESASGGGVVTKKLVVE